MFARTDRLPAWMSAHERADTYPVEVRRDPPEIEALRRRIESDIAERRRYSVFDASIEGARYQVVVLLTYQGITRERLPLPLRGRVILEGGGRARYSVFDASIEGARYQVVVLLTYQGITRERLDRAFGAAINLEWVRDHYFNDILKKVGQISGSAGATSFV